MVIDYKAIARAITDPENQPHQWNNQELAEFFVYAADEIERLQEALRLERQLRDSALALAIDLQNELNRMNGHTWSVAAALQQKDSE